MNIQPKSTGEQLDQLDEAFRNGAFASFGSGDDVKFEQEDLHGIDFTNPSRKLQFLMQMRSMIVAHTQGQDIAQLMDEAWSASDPETRREYNELLHLSHRVAQTNLENIGNNYDHRHRTEWLDFTPATHVNRWSKDEIDSAFPDGNFLFHGTYMLAAGSIFKTGYLMSTQAKIVNRIGLSSREIELTMGGDIGLSWNLNRIVSFPGDRNHLAGFIIHPNLLDAYGQQIIVPAKCMDQEVQSVSKQISDVQKYREHDFQWSVWESARNVAVEITQIPDEMLLVHPTIDQLKKDLEKLSNLDSADFYDYSNGITTFMQGVKGLEFLSLSILFKSLLDGGDFGHLYPNGGSQDELKNLTKLKEAVSLIFTDDYLGDEFEQLAKEREALLSIEEAKKTMIPVQDLIFVCSEQDSSYWRRFFAHSEHAPKAILTFDGKRAKVANFVLAAGLGDHVQLDAMIREVIPATDKTLEWQSFFENGVTPQHARKINLRHLVPIDEVLSSKSPIVL